MAISDGYRLYLVRHAIAEERGEAYPDDTLRPLSARGTRRFRKVVRGLARLGVSLDCVLCSPLVRARQTADLLADGLSGSPSLIETGALTPDGEFQALSAALADCSRFSSIALVGHEPSIGELAARLSGVRKPLPFKKGAVCRVDVETLPPSGPGVLRWFAPPRMLVLLGR